MGGVRLTEEWVDDLIARWRRELDGDIPRHNPQGGKGAGRGSYETVLQRLRQAANVASSVHGY